MNFDKLKIDTPLGHQIGVTVFKPTNTNNKSIIISSATGVLQNYYAKFASYFSHLGYTCYTFDYYGIGESNSKTNNLKQNTISLKDWGANDQSSIVSYVKDKNPNHSIILITHSIGGQILPFNTKINLVDTIVTVASQSGYWKHWRGFERFKMFTFWNVLIPLATPIFGYFPAKKLGLFENLPKNMTYQWRRWGKKPDYMLGEFKKEDTSFNIFDRTMLSLSFPKDEFAPKSAVDWLANQFTNAEVERLHIVPEDYNIPNVGHFGFFRDTFKYSLWEMTHNWINKQE